VIPSCILDGHISVVVEPWTHTGHFYRSEIKVEEDISKATFMLSLRYRERQTNDIIWHLRLRWHLGVRKRSRCVLRGTLRKRIAGGPLVYKSSSLNVLKECHLSCRYNK
jgi:hypothetical protein